MSRFRRLIRAGKPPGSDRSDRRGSGIRAYCIAVGILGGALCGGIFGTFAGSYFPFWGGDLQLMGEPGSPARQVLSRNHMLVFGLLAMVLGGVAGLLIAPHPNDRRSTAFATAVVFTLTFVVLIVGMLAIFGSRVDSRRFGVNRSIPSTLNPVRVEQAQRAMKSGLAEIASGQHLEGPINRRPSEREGGRFPIP